MSLLDKATIITTPTAHSEGKLHSIKGGSVADFDVVRSSSATRVNAEGLIEDVATNIPRIDYTDGTASILLEPQTTQLVTLSEDFSNAVWAKTGDTVIESGYLAPDGNSTAYKISGTNGSIFQPLSLLTTTTRSIYAKTVSGTGTVQLLTHNSNTNNLFTITEQWKRFDLNTSNTTGEENFYAVDFRGSGTLSELIIWGANATNDQDYATSYIPTSGAIATRLADVITGAGDVTTFNSTEGVLYAEMAALANTTSFEVISLSNGSSSDIVGFVYRNTTNSFTASVKSGGSTSLSKTITLADATEFIKVAISYKLNEFKFYINGVLEFTDTAGNTPIGLNTLQFTDGNGTSNKFKGKVKSVITFDTALTDAELECLTTI